MAASRTTWLAANDFVVSEGLRVAHPLRMLLKLAGMFNAHRFDQAAEDAWHLGLAKPEQVSQYVLRIGLITNGANA